MTHDELVELIPLLVVDALSEGEREEVRKHLSSCASCAALLQEYQSVSEQLLHSTPVTPWAPNLEMRLRARMRALQSLDSLSTLPPPEARRAWQRALNVPRWAAFAVSLAFVAVLALAAWSLWNWQASQDAVASAREDSEMVKLLETPGTLSVNVSGTDRAPTAMGQVILNPDNTRAYLIVNNLAPLTGDQVYQVWLTRDGQRDNAGTFTVDSKGHALVRIWASKPWSSYQEIGVTLEPGRGSQWPTTPCLIGGPLRY